MGREMLRYAQHDMLGLRGHGRVQDGVAVHYRMSQRFTGHTWRDESRNYAYDRRSLVNKNVV
jgi:hypothetical protein